MKPQKPTPPLGGITVHVKPNSFSPKVVPDWKLAVVGGEDFDDYKRLAKVLDKLTVRIRHLAVLTRDVRGCDRLVQRWASSRWHSVFVFDLGDVQQLVDAAERAVAFVGVDEVCTPSLVKRLRKADVPTRVYRY